MFQQTPVFITTPQPVSFFNFAQINGQTQGGDEDDDDDEYTGTDGEAEPAQDDGMIDEEDTGMQEEMKQGGDIDGEDSSSDEETALQECCIPETNALQELQSEIQENFDIQAYNKFKAQLELEE